MLFRDNFQNAETWQTLVDFNELDKLLGKRDRLSLKDITLENIHPHEGEKAPNYEVLIRRDPKWGIIITAFLSKPTLEEGYFVYKAVELVEKRPDKSLISIIRLQNKCQNYWHLTGLIEKSIYNEYKEDIVLVGDIKVTRDGGYEMVDLIARDDEDGTNRNVYENPKYNLHCSLDDDNLWKIPGISKLMDYINSHELYNMIVEFIVYDCKVGVRKENVVIVELRSNY